MRRERRASRRQRRGSPCPAPSACCSHPSAGSRCSPPWAGYDSTTLPRDTGQRGAMSAVWSYDGKRVIVVGGGGAGMGAAAVTELADLGAEIHVLDLKEPPVEVASYQSADLRDPGAVASAIDKVGGRVDAVFNCAGLPG